VPVERIITTFALPLGSGTTILYVLAVAVPNSLYRLHTRTAEKRGFKFVVVMIGRSIYTDTSNTFRKLVSVISVSE